MTKEANDAVGHIDPDSCCEFAILESIQIVNDTVEYISGQTHLRGDLELLVNSPEPCSAAYNGPAGASSQVGITYDWCRQYCGTSWALSKSKTRSQIQDWLQPLVSYMVLSVIFCLNIIRRRRIRVGERFFPDKFSSAKATVLASWQIPVASMLVTVGLILWVSIVFCHPGPMILAGICEAVINLRILAMLQEGPKSPRFTIRQRAELLFIILLGNLDVQPASQHLSQQLERLPDDSKALYHIANKRRGQMTLFPQPTVIALRSLLTLGNHQTQKQVRMIKLREPAMLSDRTSRNQNTASMYASISSKFWINGRCGCDILYRIFHLRAYRHLAQSCAWVSRSFNDGEQMQSDRGRSGAAHGLAFGVFWMTIPHFFAIVSTFLLAADNTKVWEFSTPGSQYVEHQDWVRRHSAEEPTSNQFAETISKTPADDFGERQSIKHIPYKTYRISSTSVYTAAWFMGPLVQQSSLDQSTD